MEGSAVKMPLNPLTKVSFKTHAFFGLHSVLHVFFGKPPPLDQNTYLGVGWTNNSLYLKSHHSKLGQLTFLKRKDDEIPFFASVIFGSAAF